MVKFDGSGGGKEGWLPAVLRAIGPPLLAELLCAPAGLDGQRPSLLGPRRAPRTTFARFTKLHFSHDFPADSKRPQIQHEEIHGRPESAGETAASHFQTLCGLSFRGMSKAGLTNPTRGKSHHRSAGEFRAGDWNQDAFCSGWVPLPRLGRSKPIRLLDKIVKARGGDALVGETAAPRRGCFVAGDFKRRRRRSPRRRGRRRHDIHAAMSSNRISTGRSAVRHLTRRFPSPRGRRHP